MIVTVGNWILNKVSEEPNKINVRLIANSLSPDKEDDEFLPQAFNKANVTYFIKNGIIDWFHKSMVGRTAEEKAASILGKPYDFQWEDKKPVVYGYLTKAHPIVQSSILPHLEAEQNVFGASVGGTFKKAQTVIDKTTRKTVRQIQDFVWNHLAIAPLPYVVSFGTAVSIVKAQGCADEVLVGFSDISNFIDGREIVNREDQIFRAMEMGAGTDSAALSGGSAFRGQSLEGDKQSLGRKLEVCRNFSDVTKILIRGITSGKVAPRNSAVRTFLKTLNIKGDQADCAIRDLRIAVHQLINDK